MKKWSKWLISGFCLFLALGPIAIVSSVKTNTLYLPNKNLVTPSLDISSWPRQDINPIDYWEKKHFNLSSIKTSIKKRTTDIVKKYRLDEWDKYYAQLFSPSTNQPQSKIGSALNISYKDYCVSYKKTIYGDQALNTNDLINKQVEKLNKAPTLDNFFKLTKEYVNQDYQYRYFNDFLLFFNYSDIKDNVIINEDEKTQADLLYLRWLYFSAISADRANNLNPNQKNIREVNFNDWVTAVNKAMIGEVTALTDLIQAFTQYYLLNGPGETLLAAIDLWMRCSSKPQFEINNYPQWKPKIKRAIQIYDITVNKHWNLLENSLDPTKLPSDEPPSSFDKPDENNNGGGAEELFEQIKTQLSQVKTELLSLTLNISLREYTNIKE